MEYRKLRLAIIHKGELDVFNLFIKGHIDVIHIGYFDENTQSFHYYLDSKHFYVLDSFLNKLNDSFIDEYEYLYDSLLKRVEMKLLLMINPPS